MFKCTFPSTWKKNAAAVSLVWDYTLDSSLHGKCDVHVMGEVVQKIQFIADFIYYTSITWDIYDNTIYIAVVWKRKMLKKHRGHTIKHWRIFPWCLHWFVVQLSFSFLVHTDYAAVSHTWSYAAFFGLSWYLSKIKGVLFGSECFHKSPGARRTRGMDWSWFGTRRGWNGDVEVPRN